MILLDIPKPKRCLYCPMIDYKHDTCTARPNHAGEERLSELEERPSWCPIVAECFPAPKLIKNEEEHPEEVK